VLGMDVLSHCVSGQRPLVSNVPAKVLDALCVSADKTDEDRTLVSSQMRYMNQNGAAQLTGDSYLLS